jgi:glycosyltransferase involved in cell wall biosynthesis
LVSDHVGLSAYVSEQQLGWVCKLEADDIKETILKAFYDQERVQKIRQLAPEIIRKDFDDRVLVNRYLDMYKGLV